MFIRNIMSFAAKRFYKQEYSFMKKKLLEIYSSLDVQKLSTEYNILEKILISGEDHRFQYHFGFDPIAIVRALIKNTIYQKKEGASTIEQQLVRVLTNDYNRSYTRKIKEILLSTTLCEIVPRRKIPFIYLSVAYYGYNMFGLREVTIKMGISNLEEITEETASEIIARIKYPEGEKSDLTRANQICIRKSHLLHLYRMHSNKKYLTIYS